jgi:hypothetical protein
MTPIEGHSRRPAGLTDDPRIGPPLTSGDESPAAGCGFVPPYLLRHLAAQEHPTIAANEHPSGQTLAIDAAFRERRAGAAAQAPSAPVRAVAVDQGDRWVIHSAGNQETLPGTVARSEGDGAVDDLAVDEAYAWTQQVWDLYEQQFDRRSFDGVGSTVTVTVHYGQNYDNAFWDGEQLVFGDGDGEIFERFTKPADVLAHEFSHGVVQYTSAFSYADQPGALNESIADVFASMSIQRAAGQTADQASWLIGEGLFKPGINAKALRSMLEPGTAYDDPQLGKDPQVGSMADYVDTGEDNGGVHVNSGIPNRAFALAATSIGGQSWDQAGQAWYGALTSEEVGAETDFLGFAEATVAAAGRPVDVGSDPATPPQSSDQPAPDSSGSDSSGSDDTDPEQPTQDPAAESPQKVAVRRSGGFTGQVRSAEIELEQDDARAAEVRRLLRRVDLQQVSPSEAAPDRFVYTVEVGDRSITLGERDLTPDLQRVVQLVLGTGGSGLPEGGLDLT